jgi:hypothetical protein
MEDSGSGRSDRKPGGVLFCLKDEELRAGGDLINHSSSLPADTLVWENLSTRLS